MKFSDSKVYCVSAKKCVPPFVFMLMILAGIVLGIVIICISDKTGEFYRLLFTHNIFKTRADVEFIDIFLRNLFPLLFLLVVQFFSGYFAFGQTFAYITAVYRGLATGISAVFSYIVFGGNGFFVILASIIPFAVVTAAVIILGAREAVRQSRQVADFSFFGKNENTPPDMKLYLIKFLVLVIAAVIFSFADGIVTYFLWNRIFYC